MLPGLAPASCAISRIETALKPLVENSTSAALRMASRIFEFRVIGFDSVFHLYECTKELVLSTKKRRTILRAAAISPVFVGTKSRQPRLRRHSPRLKSPPLLRRLRRQM